MALRPSGFIPFVLACSLASTAAEAAGAPCGKNISLAYYELGALYQRMPNGEHNGIDRDVVDELAKRSGCTFDTRLESRVRIWTLLETGKLDATVSGIASPERLKFAQFIPYFTARNRLILHREQAAGIVDLNAFLNDPALRIGVVKGFRHGPTYDAWLDRLRAMGRVQEIADIDEVYHLFRHQRIDAMLSLPTAFVPLLKRYALEDKVVTLDWVPNEQLVHGLVLSRSQVSPQSFQLLNVTLHKMRSDGTLLRIYNRHIGADYARQMLNDLPDSPQ